jgi:hypothetical protein
MRRETPPAIILFLGGPIMTIAEVLLMDYDHRAQLGVYLRLNNLPVPALYGPSADDRMGF